MLNVKEASWKSTPTFLLVSITVVALINLVLFPSDLFAPLSGAAVNLIDWKAAFRCKRSCFF